MHHYDSDIGKKVLEICRKNDLVVESTFRKPKQRKEHWTATYVNYNNMGSQIDHVIVSRRFRNSMSKFKISW